MSFSENPYLYQQRLDNAATMQEDYGQAAKGRWMGPYPPEDFLNGLLTINKAARKRMNRNIRSRSFAGLGGSASGDVETPKKLHQLFVSSTSYDLYSLLIKDVV